VPHAREPHRQSRRWGRSLRGPRQAQLAPEVAWKKGVESAPVR
jgi:hypothetical protein